MTKRAMIESFPETATQTDASYEQITATDPMRAAYERRMSTMTFAPLSELKRADRSIPIRSRSHSRSHRAIR